MSFIDKVIHSVTPAAAENERRLARVRAEKHSVPGDWLSRVLYHHQLIEIVFDRVQRADDPCQARSLQQQLAVLLLGHANAEESVLYPALARLGARGYAGIGYSEQAELKMKLAELDFLSPLSRGHLDKLTQIRERLIQHMYEEESRWFLQLRIQVEGVQEVALTRRYQREFDRYWGGERSVQRESSPIPDFRRAASRQKHRGVRY